MKQPYAMRLGLSVALVALGSLAAASCGDDDPSPPDARRPPDARQAADANRPSDANRSPDGGGTRDDGGTSDGGGTADSGSTSDSAVANCDPAMDLHEPNDMAETAPVVPPASSSANPDWIYGDWRIEACLGHSNEDWYRINASQLRWDLDEGFSGSASLRLRTLIAGTELCANDPGCNADRLPDAPENTVTVSVYRASDKTLLAMGSGTYGLVKITERNASFDEDLLVSVSGPPEALYSYRLTLFLDVSNSEDECEC